jgi:hypothetical protein
MMPTKMKTIRNANGEVSVIRVELSSNEAGQRMQDVSDVIYAKVSLYGVS